MKKPIVTAIVLAAGKGSRMRSNIQKQYMELKGYPVLYYSLKCFQESEVMDIILVVGEGEQEFCQRKIVEKYGFSKVSQIITGGKERYDSVYKGLLAADHADYVMIHDGARPFVNQAMIKVSIEQAEKYDFCTVGVPTKDTIKTVADDGMSEQTLDRSKLWNVQTPQTFLRSELIKAYDFMQQAKDTMITDDTMIVERYLQRQVKMVMGDYNNIKITTPEDIALAEFLLSRQ